MPIIRTAIPIDNPTTVANTAWSNQQKSAINNLLANSADFSLMTNHVEGFIPSYVNATSYMVNPGLAIDTSGSVMMSSTSQQTFSVNTVGLNGVLQSGNLVGNVSTMISVNVTTVSSNAVNFNANHQLTTGQPIIFNNTYSNITGGNVYYARVSSSTQILVFNTGSGAINNTGSDQVTLTNGSPSGMHLNNGFVIGNGTQFTQIFQPNDVISITGVGDINIASVQSDILLTLSTVTTSSSFNTTYRRGGNAVGTWYYAILVSNGSSGSNTVPVWSTRSPKLGQLVVDLPLGYPYYKDLNFVAFNVNLSQLYRQEVESGWPYQPVIRYTGDVFSYYNNNIVTPGSKQVLPSSAGTITSQVPSFSVKNLVPPTATSTILHVLTLTTSITSGIPVFGITGTNTVGVNMPDWFTFGGYYSDTYKALPLTTSGSSAFSYFYGRTTTAVTGGLVVDVAGFIL